MCIIKPSCGQNWVCTSKKPSQNLNACDNTLAQVRSASFLHVCGMQEQLDEANASKAEAIGVFTDAIEEEKKEQWRLEGRNYLFDARKVSAVKSCRNP